jgi:phage host-nuclease inhibitor protein Gam
VADVTESKDDLKAVASEMNDLLGQIDDDERELTIRVSARDELIKAANDQYNPGIHTLNESRDKKVDRLAELYAEHGTALANQSKSGKSLIFQNGTLSARMSAESIEIDDTAQAMAHAKKHGMLRKVTKVPARVFVKDKLKQHRSYVKSNPFMHFKREERLTIKLAKLGKELIRDLFPHRRSLN